MADDHDVDVDLPLSHPGYLDNQPERVSNVEDREVKGELLLQVLREKDWIVTAVNVGRRRGNGGRGREPVQPCVDLPSRAARVPRALPRPFASPPARPLVFLSGDLPTSGLLVMGPNLADAQ